MGEISTTTTPEGRYYEARRTPDGPLVTRHDPPDFEGITLPDRGYDWGSFEPGAFRLAEDLLADATGARPDPWELGDFVILVVSDLPQEGWRRAWAELREMSQIGDEGLY